MSFDSLLIDRLEIQRAALATPAAVDEWNQPLRTAAAVVATVNGRVEPLSIREVALLSDAGSVVGEYRAFMRPTDIAMSDRVRRVDTDETFEIRSIADAAGAGHHLQLLLHRVTD